jgi:predicted TPR repeat methyltransferase
MSLGRETTTAEDFDGFYVKEDPWGVRNSIQELARISKFKEIFKNTSFINGLDIGCGEGHFTSTLNFVENLQAIDISEVALQRARLSYPDITFTKADLRDLSEIKNDNFDFISCLESIYYLDGDAERKKALGEIKAKGTDNCVFCFSVVTIGENQHRKYFTNDEAIDFFSSEFNIINQFPISLIYQKQSFVRRVFNKIQRTLFGREFSVDDYLNCLNSATPHTTYQRVFVLTKKAN